MLYSFDEFEVNEQEFSLTRSDGRVSIEPRALHVLLVLLENQGRLMEKRALLEAVWKDTYVEESTLTRTIAVIRKALRDDPRSPRFIETVHTRGYRFIATVQACRSILPPAEPAYSAPESTAPTAPPHAEAVPPAASPDFSAERPMQNTSRRWMPWYSAAVGCAVIAGVVAFVEHRTHAIRPFSTRDTLVLGDFSNYTEDPVFDDALRQGMLVQLEQSPVLRLASDGQIRKTLQQMALRPDARLSAEVGREICQRIGGNVVLDGSISRLGTDFVVALRARRCSTGEEVDAQQVQIARKEDALNALSQIATRFRTRIGEGITTIKDLDTLLAEATTSSLDALKAYSRGITTFNTKGSRAALPLFQQATVTDPKFAAAHVWLGRMYADLGEDASAIESTQLAYKLRDRTSDRERFSIDVSYDVLVTGNLERARNACEAWIQMYPRDVYPLAFLSGLIDPAYGEYERALTNAKAAIAADPEFVIGYRNAAINLIALNRADEAEQVLAQAEHRNLYLASFVTNAYRIAFLKGDAGGMKHALDAAPRNPWLLFYQAATLAREGKLVKAHALQDHALELARHGNQHDLEADLLVNAAFTNVFYGLPEVAVRQTQSALRLSASRTVASSSALVLAMAGRSAEAAHLADELLRRFPEDTLVRYNYVPTVRSALALAKKHPQRALVLLQDAGQFEPGLPLYPMYLRGQAYLELGQGTRAVAEFRKIVDNPGLVLCDPLLNMAQMNLAKADSLANDKQAAKAALDAVLQRWSGADPEFAPLKRAKLERARMQ